MRSPDPALAPIFIVGTGRSGTTLLRLMLCAHPRIYVSHESMFYVWDRLFARHRSGDEFLRYYFQTFSFCWLGIDPADVLSQLPAVPLAREKVGDAFRVVMRIHAARYGRVRFGDKTLLYPGSLARMYADFPDARIIHIVRDPRGTILSLSQMPWASSSDFANAAIYETGREQVAPFRDRVLQIRLEDLLGEPRSTMERVLGFVGEPWDEAVLDHARHLPAADDMPPVPWLEPAGRSRAGPGVRWQDMPPVRIRLIETLCRKSLAAYGYAPATLPSEPGRLRVLWAALASIPEAVCFAFLYARLFRSCRRDPDCFFGDAASKRLFARLNPAAWSHYPGFKMPDPPPLPQRGHESARLRPLRGI
jgi:hypothetical protein